MELTSELLKYLSVDNLLFILIALFGMFGHAYKKYITGALKGSITDYLFKNNPNRTLMAVFATVGACAALILGDQTPTQAGAWVLLAFTTGYTADSSANSDG